VGKKKNKRVFWGRSWKLEKKKKEKVAVEQGGGGKGGRCWVSGVCRVKGGKVSTPVGGGMELGSLYGEGRGEKSEREKKVDVT